MAALVAVMRKLLDAIFGMFKHDAACDGNQLCPALATAALPEVADAAQPSHSQGGAFNQGVVFELIPLKGAGCEL